MKKKANTSNDGTKAKGNKQEAMVEVVWCIWLGVLEYKPVSSICESSA